MADPTAVRERLENTTVGLGSATTVPTGARIYAPSSFSTGTGIPNAENAVAGTETTVMSSAALVTTGAGVIGGAYLLAGRNNL